MPKKADQWLRRLPVTPDMHRDHHSVGMRETNGNCSFNRSIRDRIFGTFRARPQKGRTDMVIGLP